ncbi:lipase member H-like [Aphis craccivora]|uniref:Lipase member H-like n=1 Tax=Aphis craccivora TaxID=307492 RepID=A0A6G0ZFD1_APHCR|nr:lipase member H-like [Aphis craccivora]
MDLYTTNFLKEVNFEIQDQYSMPLDPAQPNFKDSQKNERVDVDSGQFVMVLHTSTMFLGLREPVGHVDFYFNGGQMQPSCNSDTVKNCYLPSYADFDYSS